MERDYLFLPGLPMHAIIAEVAEKHGLTYAEIISPRRWRPIVIARHEAIWRCAKETTASFPAIGREFDRDHTSIIHAIRKHEERARANG